MKTLYALNTLDYENINKKRFLSNYFKTCITKKKKKRCIATIRDTFRQPYRNGLPFPPPEDLPDPGIKPVSLESPALASGLFTTEPPEKPSRFSG